MVKLLLKLHQEGDRSCNTSPMPLQTLLLALVISQIEKLLHTCRSLQQSYGDNHPEEQHANQMDIELNQDPFVYCADMQEVSSARSIHAVKSKRMSDARIRKQSSNQTQSSDSTLNVHRDLMAELRNALPAFNNLALSTFDIPEE